MLTFTGVISGLAIGFVGGLLSGMFGIGGGIVTTPLIRLGLGVSALQSVATTLPGIIPSAITGSSHYLRARVADWRIGVAVGLAGALTSALGALAVTEVGGAVALLLTAGMIFYAAIDTIHSLMTDHRTDREDGEDGEAGEADPAQTVLAQPREAALANARPDRTSLIKSGVIGIVSGFYSGFLGLGGGFLIVPLLRRWVGLSHKQAVGTSLLAVAILAVPGTVTHALLGNINWVVAATLAVGVVPGASLGAKIMIRSSERTAKVAFAILMVVLGSWLLANELGLLG